jgi:uncharacterized membrane protein YbhN (UPF0104 family)
MPKLLESKLIIDAGRRVTIEAVNWMRQHRVLVQTVGFLTGLTILGVGVALSLRTLPDLLQRLHPLPYAVLLLVGVPATVALNTYEYQLITAMGGRRVRWVVALEISIVTSIANMLPIPGGAMARAVAMKSEGISLGLAALLIVALLVSWAGAAFLYSGFWVLGFGHLVTGWSFIVLGFALLLTSVVLLASRRVAWRLIAASLVLRGFGLVLEAIRMMLAAASIGLPLQFSQASVFSTGSVIGSAISILPGGMGVAESVMAILSPLAGLPSGVGFVIGVANRLAVVVGLLWLLAVIALMKLRNRSLKR